jgi:hypothetical protein
LYADDNYFTHFTGFMLEEEIAALLWGSTSSATHNPFYDTNNFVSCRHEIFGKKIVIRKFIRFQLIKGVGKHFFTKIKLWMQLYLLKWIHTKFVISICKTLDVTNKKPIFDC